MNTNTKCERLVRTLKRPDFAGCFKGLCKGPSWGGWPISLVAACCLGGTPALGWRYDFVVNAPTATSHSVAWQPPGDPGIIYGVWTDSDWWYEGLNPLGKVPNNTVNDLYYVTLNRTEDLYLDLNVAISGLYFAGGTDKSGVLGTTEPASGAPSCTLNVLEEFDWTGGTISGTGQVNLLGSRSRWVNGTIAQGATVSVFGPLDMGCVENLGARNCYLTGTLNLKPGAVATLGFGHALAFDGSSGVLNVESTDSLRAKVLWQQRSLGTTGTINNNGDIIVSTPSGVSLSSGVRLNNLSDGQFILECAESTHQFFLLAGLAVYNDGLIESRKGLLSHKGSTGSFADPSSGTFSVRPAGEINFEGSTHYLDAGSRITGEGRITFTKGTLNMAGTYDVAGTTYQKGGQMIFQSGGHVNPGTIEAEGGSLHFDTGHPVAIGSLTLKAGSALYGLDTVNVGNAFSWTGGTVQGSLYSKGPLTMNIGDGNPATTTIGSWSGSDNRTLYSTATMNLLTGTTLDWTGTGNTSIGGTLNNSGEIHIKTDAHITAPTSGARKIVNRGLFQKTDSTGTTAVAPAFVNDGGTIQVKSGVLSFTSLTEGANGGTIDVASGAQLLVPSGTLTLTKSTVTGSGTIKAPTLTLGGALSPGASPGKMTVEGNLTLSSSSTLTFEIDGTGQGTTYDYLDVNGSLILQGGQLQLVMSSAFLNAAGKTFTVATANSAISGQFGNVASGTRLATSGNPGTMLVSYSGSDIVLSDWQAVPEPTAAGLVGGLSALSVLFARRRRAL